MHRIVEVKVPGRRNQIRVGDDLLQLAGLVVNHNHGGILIFSIPNRKPDFIARLVVFRLNDALGTFT